MLILAPGGYFLTFGHCFLPLPKSQEFGGETIEIRDYEEFVPPPESDTFTGALARARWRFTCPGQVRFVEAARAPTPFGNSLPPGLQLALMHLGYEFPHGCFAATEPANSIGGVCRWRIAHYPTVLDRIQKDLNVRLIARPPRTDLIDPGPQFQKSFEQVDLIEFVIHCTGPYLSNHNVVTVDNREDVHRFFEILQFVPYDKGSSWICDCDGEEDVRAYREGVLVGEFTIHDRMRMRWSPLGTDIHLTTESIEALEAYLNQQVYGMKVPIKVRGKHAPFLGLIPFEMPAKNHINVENAEQPGSGQPATKPADEVPETIQPPPPTPKDGPR